MAKRAAREAAEKPAQPQPQRRAAVKKTVKIGRPGYRVTKQFDPEQDQRSLLFQVSSHSIILCQFPAIPALDCEGKDCDLLCFLPVLWRVIAEAKSHKLLVYTWVLSLQIIKCTDPPDASAWACCVRVTTH